jgi:hypothetical protein
MFDERYEGVVAPGVTWKEAMDFPGAFQMGYLRRLMESRPFLTRVPADDLILSEQTPPTHISATRDSEGSYAMVYIPNASQTMTISTATLTGEQLKAWWFDPRTGEASEIETFTNDASHTFTSPADGPDWVLVIDDADSDFAPPSK